MTDNSIPVPVAITVTDNMATITATFPAPDGSRLAPGALDGSVGKRIPGTAGPMRFEAVVTAVAVKPDGSAYELTLTLPDDVLNAPDPITLGTTP